MRKYIYLFIITLLSAAAWSQSIPVTDSKLSRQLEESNYLRHTMKADPEDAGLTRWYQKDVQKTRELSLIDAFDDLVFSGPGKLSINKQITKSGKGSICMDVPASLGEKNKDNNRAYAAPEFTYKLNREDLRAYNRISAWVYMDAPGVYLVFGGLRFHNEGEKIMPTPGRFEGQHFETYIPGQWRRVVWEIPDIYRDCVTGISFNVFLAGEPAGASDRMQLYVDDLRIESVDPENSRGFNLRKDAIAYSHSGYKSDARKQAMVQHIQDNSFQICNALTGSVVFEGKGQKSTNGFVVLDFSELKTPGQYIIRTAKVSSKPFAIGDEAYLATAWRTLNYFFAERCGYDQPGIHQECHQDVFCFHPDGRSLSVAGGWHDAGDMTQGIGNTSDGGIAMLELAEAVKVKDKKLYDRLLEEARWGLNWVMRTRFGDGYRQGGLVIGLWTKNIRGDKDDMQSVARNNPSSNLAGAAYCAMAVPHFEKTDPVFARWCRNCAIEDFGFAVEAMGINNKSRNEVELAAQATVTAMRMYELTKDAKYIDYAARFARTVMAGQQLERRKDWSIPLRGFFYETTEKKRTIAYYHQSKEHMMIQGLAMLLTKASNHKDAPLWKESCEAYKDYLHDLSGLIEPYGILPSAVYELDNTDYSNVSQEGRGIGDPTLEEYNAQVKNGIRLSKTHYLRRFPVAYQFRGFHAIHMGKAKAGFILARLLNDKELKDISTRQFEYILGYNPFAMSTIYGDGYDYPPLYGAFAGDVVGAVPVGIETFENDDEPYFPMQNNCTYKEIWTHTTAQAMWLVAELFKN